MTRYKELVVIHINFTLMTPTKYHCPFDDKRYMLDDKINTLAYGHYNIKNEKEKQKN